MISYILDITDKAKYKLNQLTNYILYELQNPIASENTSKGIYKTIYFLASNPYIGSNYNSNIKFIRFKNYLIYYEINEKEKNISIKTIMHRRQNRINLN